MLLERGCYLVSYVWTSYSTGEAQWSMDGCSGLAPYQHGGCITWCLVSTGFAHPEVWRVLGRHPRFVGAPEVVPAIRFSAPMLLCPGLRRVFAGFFVQALPSLQFVLESVSVCAERIHLGWGISRSGGSVL